VNEFTRALVIIGAVAIALAAVGLRAAYCARARRNSVHTESLRPWPAVVVFTSTDCDACAPVRNLVFGRAPAGVGREIVYQGGAEQFRSAGVDKVPVVVVIDGRGVPVGVYEGQVTSRRIGWALRKAGVR
jgi:hypothetical protein